MDAYKRPSSSYSGAFMLGFSLSPPFGVERTRLHKTMRRKMRKVSRTMRVMMMMLLPTNLPLKRQTQKMVEKGPTGAAFDLDLPTRQLIIV